MIRQIVVEQEDGKPDLVGLLLTSRDLPQAEAVKLGERLARMEQVRNSDSLRGQYKGIRWKWVPVDHVTPGLEFHTIVVPRGTLAGASRAVTSRGIVEVDQFAVSKRLMQLVAEDVARPCDGFPAWLWVVAALVVLGVLVAVVSPAFIAGVL